MRLFCTAKQAFPSVPSHAARGLTCALHARRHRCTRLALMVALRLVATSFTPPNQFRAHQGIISQSHCVQARLWYLAPEINADNKFVRRSVASRARQKRKSRTVLWHWAWQIPRSISLTPR